MHVLLAITGAIVMAAVWWWRIKMVSEAAADVADGVGRVRGQLRRRSMRRKAEQSPVAAIDSPIVAAAVLLVALQSEKSPLMDEQQKFLRSLLTRLVSEKEAEEALIYGNWAVSQIADSTVVIGKLGLFLRDALNMAEKKQFIALLDEANAKLNGCHDYRYARQRLIGRLGPDVAS